MIPLVVLWTGCGPMCGPGSRQVNDSRIGRKREIWKNVNAKVKNGKCSELGRSPAPFLVSGIAEHLAEDRSGPFQRAALFDVQFVRLVDFQQCCDKILAR